MIEPLFFGRPQRAMFGVLHRAQTAPQEAMLVCTPLLQEGIRSQRALWTLAEALAVAGIDVLRFDWFGSGDSGGESAALDFDGLLDDLHAARSLLSQTSSHAQRVRVLALHSAALPALAQAARQGDATDLVLWDPVLDGSSLLATWRSLHAQQLHSAGRYTNGSRTAAPDELLGFDVSAGFTNRLAAVDAGKLELPAGSRVLLAVWAMTPALEAFADAQRNLGVQVDSLVFETAETPTWEDRFEFERQIFPRRSVTQLAARLAMGSRQ